MNRHNIIGFLLIYGVAAAWFIQVYNPYAEGNRAIGLATELHAKGLYVANGLLGGPLAAGWAGRNKLGRTDLTGDSPAAVRQVEQRQQFTEEAQRQKGETFRLETPYQWLEWSADGASLRQAGLVMNIDDQPIYARHSSESFVPLPQHFTNLVASLELRELPSTGQATRQNTDKTGGARGLLKLARDTWQVSQPSEHSLRFDYLLGEQLWLTKHVEVSPDPEGAFVLRLDVSLENRGSRRQTFGYELCSVPGLVEEDTSQAGGLLGLTCQRRLKGGVEDMRTRWVDDDILTASRHVAEGRADDSEEVAWFGVASKYFAALVIPLEHTESAVFPLERTESAEGAPGDHYSQAGSQMPPTSPKFGAGFLSTARVVDVPLPWAEGHDEYRNAQDERTMAAFGTVSPFAIAPGQQITHRYLMFLGPKDDRVLNRHKQLGLPQALNLGWFEAVSNVFVRFLRFLFSLTGSWGVGIIILTVCVRSFLHPFSRMTQRGSQGMQKLAPQMKEIKEKYKDKSGRDSMQKMNAEMMEMYRKNNMSPYSGCLPFFTIFLQLPVFLGLYNALSYVFELRQKSFLYIADLTEPDALFQLPFQLPFLETSDFNLLPLLMMVVMLIQQQLTPKPEDPQQQQMMKIMKFMMVGMVFIFYTIPSGLVLYFVTSSTIGIAESHWIRKTIKKDSGAKENSDHE